MKRKDELEAAIDSALAGFMEGQRLLGVEYLGPDEISPVNGSEALIRLFCLLRDSLLLLSVGLERIEESDTRLRREQTWSASGYVVSSLEYLISDFKAAVLADARREFVANTTGDAKEPYLVLPIRVLEDRQVDFVR